MALLSDRFPLTAPVIQPISDASNRPLWSVMIPIYNCAAYIEETLRSVLAQDLGRGVMQIQVVDDASTDIDVQALVARIGGGRIDYYRQVKNVGSLRNFETCINRARGHLIHLLHADDRVEAGFYEWMTQLFAKYPEAGAAFCRYASIDASGNRIGIPPTLAENDGILTDWLVRIAQQQSVQYASMAVRRTVYEHIGSFYGTSYGEDWEMWVRIARYYPVAYTPKVLAEYRSRAHSMYLGESPNQQLSTGFNRRYGAYSAPPACS